MRDGTATREAIRLAALRLFVERGVNGVSVRDIAAMAGIQPATLYVHWESREALIADLFRTGYAGYARSLAEAAGAGGRLGPRLVRIIERVAALYAEDERLFRFLLLTQHTNLPHLTADCPNPIEVVQQVIAEGRAAGETSGEDPALLAAAVVGLVVQSATFHHYGRLAPSPAAIVPDLVRLALKIVSPNQPPPGS